MYKKLPDVLWFQEGPGVRKHQYRETGVKLINVANLVHGKVDLTTSKRYISEEEAYGKYSHFMIDAGDFIIASSGIQVETMDEKCGFIQEWQLPLCMNTSTIRFKSLDSKQLDIKFFSYFVKSAIYKDQIEKLITGIAQLNFGPSHLKKVQIPIPPLTTQQQIVSELDLLSHILDQKRQQLKEYDALAESIFYDMFGDESKFKKEKLVKLTTKIGSGATPKGGNQAYKDEGISLIRSLNVHNAEFKYEDLAHIDEEQAAALNNVTLEKNDVLFNITGASVTRCCIVPENVLPARVNQHVAILRPCTEVLNYIFLSHLLISSHYHDKLYALSRSNGATREAITKAQLENFVIPLPPLDLQRSFASKIESIEHQKQLLRASIKETEMLFQSRMDYWFNG